MSEAPPDSPEARIAWATVSSAFAALGRGFICADEAFRVLGASGRAGGRLLQDLLGPELFGAAGALRHTLVSGQRREGWRAHLQLEGFAPRLVSLSAAPFAPGP